MITWFSPYCKKLFYFSSWNKPIVFMRKKNVCITCVVYDRSMRYKNVLDNQHWITFKHHHSIQSHLQVFCFVHLKYQKKKKNNQKWNSTVNLFYYLPFWVCSFQQSTLKWSWLTKWLLPCYWVLHWLNDQKCCHYHFHFPYV